MKIPNAVKAEIIRVLSTSTRTRLILIEDEYSPKTWRVLKALSKEEIFNIYPPKKLSGGSKRGLYKSECLNCGGKTKFQKYSSGYRKYCSIKCASAYDWVNNEDVRLEAIKKTQKTMQRRYGGKTTMTSRLKAKVIASSGFFNNRKANMVKCRQTKLARYGPKGRSEETIEKANATLQKTRLTNPQIYTNCMYQRKPVRIGRRHFNVQGYEGDAIRWLYKNGADIKTVVLNSVSVKYTDTNNNERVYISDFEVRYKNRRTIVEVKSDYTAGLLNGSNRTLFYNLRRKAKAMKDSGYRFVVIIMNAKKIGNLIKDFDTISITEARRLVYEKGFSFM